MKLVALTTFRAHRLRLVLSANLTRRRRTLMLLGGFVLIALQTLLMAQARRFEIFLSDTAFAGLKAFTLGLGGALIGGTAIASSFILFALQVNVERMSAGLFRRLSIDTRLLLAFGLAFALSIGLAMTSLVPVPAWGSQIALAAVEVCIAMPVLYLYAYGRALKLINPTEQLRIVLRDADLAMRTWGRRADLAQHLIRHGENAPTRPGEKNAALDRLTFFRANVGWDDPARKAVTAATLYARTYAERGDHEISLEALRVLVGVNAVYIQAKGMTFFASDPMLDNPLVTDGLINDTLEALRQTMKIAMVRGDERQATQTLATFDFLISLYLTIDYPGAGPSKTHALLAAGYLSSAVESVAPHKLADVLMEGVRIEGKAAVALIAAGSARDSATLIDKVGFHGVFGTVTPDLRPVLMTAVQQLTNVTVALLLTRNQDLRFSLDHVIQSLKLIATLLLETADTPFVSAHSSNLAPYFSYETSGLQSQLVTLVNRLGDEGMPATTVDDITSNLAAWAEAPQQSYKDLLLLALQKRSGLTFDLIAWSKVIIEVLLAASNLEGTASWTRDKLRKSALHWVLMFSWLPTDREAASYLQNNRYGPTLFEIAWMARERDGEEIADAACSLLLKWGLEAGAEETGWGILGQSVIALAAYALGDVPTERWLINALATKLIAPGSPSEEIRSRSARDVQETADEIIDPTYSMNQVAAILAKAPYMAKRAYLTELAIVLDPPRPSH